MGQNQVSLLKQEITAHSHIYDDTGVLLSTGIVRSIRRRFDDVKKHALKCLNNCPIKVICHFFNCLWHFIDAYHGGLTRKVVEWAIHKQKSHHTVFQNMMISIKAVLN
ncbi:hypothetical protein HETIRDRAFT_165911 [Heterobasidion irregulare TC 32-1]|uniref:Uncharacterized protein n=1 Tax=Heterobasidion irregulare (strain TC 32-1) TaxID=747525 RepID=W4KG45_HETIT|nr:uncharacterized protein HETIRDRAFT_165911 [Heterobasidion irregulare TC 32-1]ETW84823.1 hypothetical protein HETIRDRAFT_165911 [Heterobasidion irregulare TC 32-1]